MENATKDTTTNEDEIKPNPMLRNYFKIALRNIIRHKAYSFLNISGLAIGMACSILILLWVQNELSYDKSHDSVADIYRLTCNVENFKAAVSPIHDS